MHVERSRKHGGAVVIFLGVLLLLAGVARAASKPATLAELALYRGPDRETILLEGAKKEGQVTFYTSNTWIVKVAEEFGKRYPFIKVSTWRSDSKKQLKRVTEEYASGRYIADVVEASADTISIFHKDGSLQEHYSPEMRYYGDEVVERGKTGVFFWANREIYISLGFNSKVISPAEAPKTIEDLLDPKWKGKMAIAGTTTGVRWVGAVLDAKGREFLDKVSRQDIKVQNISGAALAGLVVAGEVPLSPTIYNSNIFTAKQKGAPVEWRPVDPVIASVGASGLLTKAPNPHAALLLLDFLHSKEGQEAAMKGGLSSPREDIGSLETKFKKVYLENKYPVDVLEQKMNDWEKLMRRLFIMKR
jgi:iron(III) transport system substrate-binding protein